MDKHGASRSLNYRIQHICMRTLTKVSCMQRFSFLFLAVGLIAIEYIQLNGPAKGWEYVLPGVPKRSHICQLLGLDFAI